MWFLVIVAGIVIVIAAGLLAGPARRAGHPALGNFTESACDNTATRRVHP